MGSLAGIRSFFNDWGYPLYIAMVGFNPHPALFLVAGQGAETLGAVLRGQSFRGRPGPRHAGGGARGGSGGKNARNSAQKYE